MNSYKANSFPAGAKGWILLLALITINLVSYSQSEGEDYPPSSISEQTLSLKTYPFTDPNPIPNFDPTRNIYPNFKMEGYTDEGVMQDWDFVIMENQFIRVYILPSMGGKIWGAVEKSTGEEFIYKNEVIKFRNVSMRGPWTCGGIELNFGLIGHTPSTASMVDYTTNEHEDGSVSCTVGTMDLTSRTIWRVTITLPSDMAWFETHASWYNPTELEQSYYNWMTATAFASQDLEFCVPGNLYVEHSGEAKPYPIDAKGRDLSKYSENAFGGNKSYHVVGSFQDYFGGYYHEKEFGFGHWGPKEAMPGQKIWMWSQSREGEIWTDLMSDTDGMHIEFQAGRMYNQYAYSSSNDRNPISQAGFSSQTFDHWKEIWFPIKGIGGMLDASHTGVLNVEEITPGKLAIGINALAPFTETLYVKQGGKTIYTQELTMKPMAVSSIDVELEENELEREVILGDKLLYYSSDREKFLIKRHFETGDLALSEMQVLYMEATESYRTRKYDHALRAYNKMAEIDALDFRVLAGLAKCHYRMAKFDQSLDYANKILRQDTYHPEGNYLAAIAYRAMGDELNARECFGWAARDMDFRTSAFTQTGELLIAKERFNTAEEYLTRALDYNRYNINALAAKTLLYRLQDDRTSAMKVSNEMLMIDPLCHFARYEQALLAESSQALLSFESGVRNEFRNETFMELALQYLRMGRTDEALDLLDMADGYVSANIWSAYLQRDSQPAKSKELLDKAVKASPAYVFPHRLESLPVLEWAAGQNNSWKMNYYLGLNYMAIGDKKAAEANYMACDDQPDFAPFYLSRAKLFLQDDQEAQLANLLRATEVDPEDWRSLYSLTEFYLRMGRIEKAAEVCEENMSLHGDNFSVGIQQSMVLLRQGAYEASLELMEQLKVLPAEDANLPRRISEQAHLLLALQQIGDGDYRSALATVEKSLLWPENLGVGEPYDYDARRQDMLLSYCQEKTKKKKQSKKMLETVCSDQFKGSPNDVLSIIALKELGRTSEAKAWTDEIAGGRQGEWMKRTLQGDFSSEKAAQHGGWTIPYKILEEISALYLE